MTSFADEVTIQVASGKGGNGCLSFRREKYIPKGGPDGGDGGRGGNVVFLVKKNVKTLAHLRNTPRFIAENGKPGQGRKKHGRDGCDVIIPVPPGTILKDRETGRELHDFALASNAENIKTEQEKTWVFLKGGRGGKGNTHFATATNQTPRLAQPGAPGTEKTLIVELRLIADIGLVGMPNAGKSSLLRHLTNAHPKVADYPFTTKEPYLGVMHAGFQDIIIADIPGLISGASHGLGMGFKFLRHITRTSGLAFLIDINSNDPFGDYRTLIKELTTYSDNLLKKERIIIATKMDLDLEKEKFNTLRDNLPDDEILIGISVYARTGFDELSEKYIELIEKNEASCNNISSNTSDADDTNTSDIL